MFFNLIVTPVEASGRQLASRVLTLSEEDVARRDFGALLRPLLLDWVEIAREIDELVSADAESGEPVAYPSK